MGAYSSNFKPPEGKELAWCTKPGNADWITAHVAGSGLSLVEVERMWMRFQQLGANEDGILAQQTIEDRAKDPFVQNILTYVRGSESGPLTFERFLKLVRWSQSSSTSLNDRVGAIFCLLNGGELVTKEVLTDVLLQLYRESESPEAVRLLSTRLMTELDGTAKGYFTEEDFVDFTQRLPYETVSAILEFETIPRSLQPAMQEASGQSEYLSQLRFTPNDTGPAAEMIVEDTLPPSDTIPSSAVLKAIARKAARKDWYFLANRLGFLTDDVQLISLQFPQEPESVIYLLLAKWKEREKLNATAKILEKHLRDSHLPECVMLLRP